MCVSFFELITKMVLMNSKTDFIENVDCSIRYNKLFYLTESNDYFFEEVNYNQNHEKNNAFMWFIIE